ncbi:MAG: LysM peptidoglycan-binding domain-containing protein [Frateuria sp.]|uniref:N-acetylmuramoyl-L-alanine amidase n=1 Tax=Frateuria sp. TaxID=2211372 RepID=UPI0017C6C779|nr:N-acetylmuramoyl-L-alanine amidase [Frateuria sp.]NUO72334.1 LysM peptidoglycan-binding domain-containing protein [Frateuria sp.]NUR22364.1 LysM peptidoglycan-binding domain-containing protein [Frateuria sp.]
MTRTLARLGRLGLVALAAVLPLRLAWAADVQAARVWAGPEYTRVVFDLSGPVDYKLSRDGDAVALELHDGNLARDFDAPVASGLFRGLDSRRSGNVLQLLARTKAGAKPKTFLLKPAADRGYRLVLDLYPGAGAATTTATAKSNDDDRAGSLAGIKPTSSVGKAAKQAAALLGGERKVIVAVDAGHGGKDPGSHGPGGTLEKNVTLAVARVLADEINRQPGMKAVLTRDGDYFIPLKRRFQIAREQNADMFVSVHADAFTSGDARGSSVWVLSPRGKTSEAARWLADRENRADLIGGVSLDDKDDSLAAVLLDLQQGYAIQASEAIAGNVLKALGQLGPTHRGYVEHANFVVLRSPDVPSILVETAFISNPAEERKLRDPAHQRQLAAAVTGGVRNYFESTPPPGTWFAAQAMRRNGTLAEAARPAPAKAATADARVVRADADVRDLHRVERGESLGTIARQYGISVRAIKSANRMSSDAVQVGAVLAIPAG